MIKKTLFLFFLTSSLSAITLSVDNTKNKYSAAIYIEREVVKPFQESTWEWIIWGRVPPEQKKVFRFLLFTKMRKVRARYTRPETSSERHAYIDENLWSKSSGAGAFDKINVKTSPTRIIKEKFRKEFRLNHADFNY